MYILIRAFGWGWVRWHWMVSCWSVCGSVIYFILLCYMHRSMDLDAILSEESFQESSKVRARYLSCPDRAQKAHMAALTSTHLRFSLPLDRQKLINKLKGKSSFLKDLFNIYRPGTVNTFSQIGYSCWPYKQLDYAVLYKM